MRLRLTLFIVLSAITLVLMVSAFWLLWVQLGELWSAFGNPNRPLPDMKITLVLVVIAGVMSMGVLLAFAWWKRGRAVKAHGSARWATRKEVEAYTYHPRRRKRGPGIFSLLLLLMLPLAGLVLSGARQAACTNWRADNNGNLSCVDTGSGVTGPLILVGLLMVGFLVFMAVLAIQQMRDKPQPGDSYGSATWAKGDEAAGYEPSSSPQSWLLLGTYKGRTIALSEEQQQSHVLVVGPTGQGKTSRIIIPGLLREQGDRSLFVIDPKSELVAKTAGAASRRHTCWFFSPTQPQQSHYYNPLAYIDTMEDAQDFAACWVANTGKSRDPFWDRNAEILITAAALHIRATEPDAPLSRLADTLAGKSYQQLKALFAGSPSSIARDIGNSFLETLAMNDRLAASILTEAGGRFFMLRSKNISEVTARNEIDFNHMVDQPTALYMSIPASASDRLRPLMACMLMQMFAAWLVRAEQSPGGTLPRAMACYLDEFANAGLIPHMARRISMLRSTRVALILAIQNFAQLDAVYGREDRATILANATTHLVLPGAGQEEAEYYSRRCGDTTVFSTSTGRSGANMTWSQREVKRRLILPEEIRTLPKGRTLMVADTVAPLWVDTMPYFATPALAKLAALPYALPQRATAQASTTP